jgi:hypothetical protein
MEDTHEFHRHNPEFWKFLMKFPAFRYMKEPVHTVSELYERYPDGLEKSAFAYVYKENTIYIYKPPRKKWEAISIGVEYMRTIEKIMSDTLTSVDEKNKELSDSIEKIISDALKNVNKAIGDALSGVDDRVADALKDVNKIVKDTLDGVDKKVEDALKNLNLVRRFCLNLQTSQEELFFYEETTINRINAYNAQTITVTLMDLAAGSVSAPINVIPNSNTNIHIPAGPILVIFEATRQQTDATIRLFIFGKAVNQ